MNYRKTSHIYYTLRRIKGFTLIELLVVVAIIALLMSVLVPSLRKAKELARRTICATQMKDTALTVRLYVDDHKDTLPPYGVFSGQNQNEMSYNHWGRWFRIGGTAPNDFPFVTWRNLGLIWNAGYWDQDFGEQLYCPSRNLARLDEDNPDLYMYETYADPVFPTNYSSGGSSVAGVRVAYFYNPECKSLTDRQRKFTRLSHGGSNMILLLDLLTSAGITHEKGWNIAKGDGSVDFKISHEVQPILEASGREFDDQDYTSFEQVLRLLK